MIAADAINHASDIAPTPMSRGIHEAGKIIARWWCCGRPLPSGDGCRQEPGDLRNVRDRREFHRLAVIAYAGAIADSLTIGPAFDVDVPRWETEEVHGEVVAPLVRRVNAIIAAIRAAQDIFDQSRVLPMTIAVARLLTQRRAIRREEAFDLLDASLGELYPRRRREQILFDILGTRSRTRIAER